MYKMINIDLDGTLLNSMGEISQGNFKELRRCISNGVEVVLTSGRVVSSIKNFAKEIGGNNYLIAGNGSTIYDLKNDKILYQNVIDKEKVLRIIEICEENSIFYNVYTEKFIISKALNYNILFYSKENLKKTDMEKTNINIVEDIYNYVKNSEDIKISKLSICDKDQVVFSSILKKLREIENIGVLDVAHMSRKYIENGTEIVPVEYYYSEIANENVNKWEAIKYLANILNIKDEEIIAIGDNINDKEMLQNAGLGVAMENAAPYIKEFAKYVTDNNNDDGVAKVIEKFVE